MKIWQSKTGGNLLVRLDRGEEICAAIKAIAQERGMRSGSIHGIGALREMELAYFDLEAKEYQRFCLEESWELLSLTGNLSVRDGEIFPHLHAVAGFRDGEVRGGHLFSGIVSVTAEVFIQTFPLPIHREIDPEVGLALLDR